MGLNKAIDAQRFASRSLYRHLLRECTYLADSHARHVFSAQVRQRFARSRAFSHDLTTKRLRDGRQVLSKLRAANDGDPRKLRYVISVAYGRRGWRKHEMLQAVLPDDHALQASIPVRSDEEPADAIAHPVPDTSDSSSKRLEWQQFIPELTPQLRALVSSQNRAQTANVVSLRHQQVKKLDPGIPELNSWFRPMPASRVKNLTKQWWVEVQAKLMPPLPSTEWLHMYDIASGRVMLQQNKRRGKDDERSALDIVASHSRIQAAHLQRPPVHRLSARSFQRAYAQVFTYCPIMTCHDQHWTFTWGNEAIQDAAVAETLRRELSASTNTTPSAHKRS